MKYWETRANDLQGLRFVRGGAAWSAPGPCGKLLSKGIDVEYDLFRLREEGRRHARPDRAAKSLEGGVSLCSGCFRLHEGGQRGPHPHPASVRGQREVQIVSQPSYRRDWELGGTALGRSAEAENSRLPCVKVFRSRRRGACQGFYKLRQEPLEFHCEVGLL